MNKAKEKTKLGQVLKELRKSESLTQGEMAKALDIGRPIYQAYEYSRAEPHLLLLYKICKFFGISMEELAEWSLGIEKSDIIH